MNIACESHSTKIEKRGINILREMLNTSDFFECHFNEEDKIPNSDGYFIIYGDESIPFKRFDVQIKSTENIKILKDESASFSINSKFINYSNIGVTEDRCVVFHIDVKNRDIYYKFLTSDFLDNFDAHDKNKEYIRIHFNSKIIEINLFYKELVAFALRKRTFNIRQINIVEYQKVYDMVNRLFDNEFIKVKMALFPDTWKFGIAYQKYDNPKRSFIADLPFTYHFGIYKIRFGDKTLPFQQVEVFEDSSLLDFVGRSVLSSIVFCPIELFYKQWLSSFVQNICGDIRYLLRFLPNDALFENVYFVAKQMGFDLGDAYSTDNLLNIIINSYGRQPENKTSILLHCLQILKQRNINSVNRVFAECNGSPLIPENLLLERNNICKLFESIGFYYEDCCSRLFNENFGKNMQLTGDYKLSVIVDSPESNILRKEYFFSYIDSGEFSLSISSVSNTKNIKRSGKGVLKTNFAKSGNNISHFVLSLLYRKLCNAFGLKEGSLPFDLIGSFIE